MIQQDLYKLLEQAEAIKDKLSLDERRLRPSPMLAINRVIAHIGGALFCFPKAEEEQQGESYNSLELEDRAKIRELLNLPKHPL